MTRPLLRLTVLAAAVFWGVAIAQDRPASPPMGGGDDPPELGVHGGRLYISPAGEPFRGPEGLRRWFEGADADHDGALTLAEFRADFMRYFKVLDANGDGAIDGTENGVYENQIAPEITGFGPTERGGGPPGGMDAGRRGGGGGHRGGHGGGMGGVGRGGGGGGDTFRGARGRGGGLERREGAARFSLLDIPQPIRGADANLDWKVTAAEWAKAAGQRFALLDTASAGKLTFDGLPPLPGRSRPAQGPRRGTPADNQEMSPRNLS